jgi:hypothetical protein
MTDRGLQYVLEYTVFKSGGLFLIILESIANVSFALVYVILLWDMVKVFAPVLRGLQQTKGDKDEEPAA